MYEKSCVGNGRFFYFDDDGRLDIFHLKKNLVGKINTSVLFIEFNSLIRNRKD